MTSRSKDSTDETTSQSADDGASNVAGATICFNPERSVRPRPSPDDEYGADDESHGHDSGVSDDIAALLANLSPNSSGMNSLGRSSFHASLKKSMKSMTLQDLQAVIGHELNKKSEMQQRLAATESHLSAANKQKGELAGKLGKMQEANVALINQVNKLLERLDTKDTSLSNAQAEKYDLSSANASLRSDIELLRQQLSESQANREHNEDKLESLCQQLSDSQATQDRTLSELHQVQANLTEATSNLDEKSNQLSNAANEKNELTGNIALLRSDIELLRQQLSDSQATRDRTLSELRQAQANLIEATSNLDEKNNQLTSITNEKNELTVNVSTLQALTNDIRSELQDSRAEHQQAASALAVSQSTVASLQSNIEQKLVEIESLREQLNSNQDPDEVQLTSTSKIDFEDVTTASTARIPNGYSGLDWDNFMVNRRSEDPGTGYEYGVVSGDYAAYNWGSKPCSISSKTPFSVAGFQATAGGRTDQEVLLEGFDGSGKLVGSRRTTLGDPRDGPAFIDLRGGKFEGLSKLKITPSGGADAGFGYKDAKVVIDDLLVY